MLRGDARNTSGALMPYRSRTTTRGCQPARLRSHASLHGSGGTLWNFRRRHQRRNPARNPRQAPQGCLTNRGPLPETVATVTHPAGQGKIPSFAVPTESPTSLRRLTLIVSPPRDCTVNTGDWAKQTTGNSGVATARSLDNGAPDFACGIKTPCISCRTRYYALSSN
jgi:hypothetical protein